MYVVENGDVPNVLRFDGRKWPLGRYLKARLRDEAGYVQPGEIVSGRSRYSAGYVRELVRLQEEMRFVVDREVRESRRKGHSVTAETRLKILFSKRTI